MLKTILKEWPAPRKAGFFRETRASLMVDLSAYPTKDLCFPSVIALPWAVMTRAPIRLSIAMPL